MLVFVSYAKADTVFGREILEVIRERGINIASRGIFANEKQWREDITESQAFVLILSQAAIADPACVTQWQIADELDARIIVLKLDESALPDVLAGANVIDFLDFQEIGRQLQNGIPALRHDRYASEVTVRMLIAELADIKAETLQGKYGTQEIFDAPTQKLDSPPLTEIKRAQAENTEETHAPDKPRKGLRRLFKGK